MLVHVKMSVKNMVLTLFLISPILSSIMGFEAARSISHNDNLYSILCFALLLWFINALRQNYTFLKTCVNKQSYSDKIKKTHIAVCFFMCLIYPMLAYTWGSIVYLYLLTFKYTILITSFILTLFVLWLANFVLNLTEEILKEEITNKQTDKK